MGRTRRVHRSLIAKSRLLEAGNCGVVVSRVFVPNFQFEMELLGLSVRRDIIQATSGLAGCFLPMLRPGDVVRNVDEEWPVAPSAVIPWGWSQRVREKAMQSFGAVDCPDVAAVARVNRRSWAARWEVANGQSGAGAIVVEDVDEVASVLRDCLATGGRWLIKADLGASGRGVSRLEGVEEGVRTAVRWMRRDGCVVVERELVSLAELGVLFEIKSDGAVESLGFTQLLTTTGGGYLGSRTSGAIDERIRCQVGGLWPTVEKVVEAVAREGYVGPVGIDAMLHKDKQGRHMWRVAQDINARWTMGRCAWEWHQQLQPDLGVTLLQLDAAWVHDAEDRLSTIEKQVPQLRKIHLCEQPAGVPRGEKQLVVLEWCSGPDAAMSEREAITRLRDGGAC